MVLILVLILVLVLVLALVRILVSFLILVLVLILARTMDSSYSGWHTNNERPRPAKSVFGDVEARCAWLRYFFRLSRRCVVSVGGPRPQLGVDWACFVNGNFW